MIGLMGSVVFAVAVPILIRISYFHRSVKKRGLTLFEFKRMKEILLVSVGVGVVFSLYSCLLPIFRYHLYLAVLAGIYGVYSVLPFRGNLRRDVKGFGVFREKN